MAPLGRAPALARNELQLPCPVRSISQVAIRGNRDERSGMKAVGRDIDKESPENSYKRGRDTHGFRMWPAFAIDSMIWIGNSEDDLVAPAGAVVWPCLLVLWQRLHPPCSKLVLISSSQRGVLSLTIKGSNFSLMEWVDGPSIVPGNGAIKLSLCAAAPTAGASPCNARISSSAMRGPAGGSPL